MSCHRIPALVSRALFRTSRMTSSLPRTSRSKQNRVTRTLQGPIRQYRCPFRSGDVSPVPAMNAGARRSSAMASNRAHTALYTVTVSEFLFGLSNFLPLTLPTIQSVHMTSLPTEGGTLLLNTSRHSRTSWHARRQPCVNSSRTSTSMTRAWIPPSNRSSRIENDNDYKLRRLDKKMPRRQSNRQPRSCP